MVYQLDDHNSREFLEREGVDDPTSPFYDKSYSALHVRNVFLCGGGVDRQDGD
jgi:hypothetical protein